MAKKKKNSKPIVYPVVFMIVLTVIFTGALAAINEATIDIIAKQEALRVKQTILYVLNLADTTDEAIIESKFDSYVQEKEVDGQIVYIGQKDGQVLGYSFRVYGPGLWGSMVGYAAVNSDFSEILGVSFVSHSETPGLGGRIDEAWFKEQFRGIPVNQDQPPITFRPKPDGNADAITGATLTSEAVLVMLNQDILEFINTIGGKL